MVRVQIRANNLGSNCQKGYQQTTKVAAYKERLKVTDICMGESFQDYSWIQDFEADFPQKVSLKMLN